MVWTYLAVGAVVGAMGGMVIARLKSEKCASDEKRSDEVVCPLCSGGTVMIVVGAVIGVVLVSMIGIATGAWACPFTVCSRPVQKAVGVAEPGRREALRVESAAKPSQPVARTETVTPTKPAPAKAEPAGRGAVAAVQPTPAQPGVPESPAKAAQEKHYAQPLTDADFAKGTGSGLAIVDFWAVWCGPCSMQAPVFEKLAQKYQGKVKFFKVDVDEEQGLGARFAREGIPALAVFKDGKFLAKRVGYHDEEALEKLVLQLQNDPLPLLFPYVMRGE